MANRLRIEGFTVEYENGEAMKLPSGAEHALRGMLMYMVLSGDKKHETTIKEGKKSATFRIERTGSPRVYHFYGPLNKRMVVTLDTAGNPDGFGGTRRRRQRRRRTWRR